jgi:hypothetical protein
MDDRWQVQIDERVGKGVSGTGGSALESLESLESVRTTSARAR